MSTPIVVRIRLKRYYVSGLLSITYVRSNFLTLGGVYHYHPHFKDENTEAQKDHLSKVTQLMRGRARQFGSRVPAF